MNKFLVTLMMVTGLNVWAHTATTKQLSFHGNATIAEVQDGKLTRSIRLKDRTQAPTSYKAGDLVAIVNTNTEEDKRPLDAQMGKYQHIELTKLTVTKFSALSAADQAELSKYYSAEKIAEAKDVVTIIEFKPSKHHH